MRSIIFDSEYSFLELNRLLNGNIDFSIFGYKTSFCLWKAKVGDVFFKKIDSSKIRNLYSGDYLDLFDEYYNKIKNIIKTNKVFGLIEKDEELYEFSRFIDKNLLLDGGNTFNWKDIDNLFEYILKDINNCVKYNKENNQNLGFDTSIWNFTINGELFDFDPPKLLRKNENSTFSRSNDEYHLKRTLYRSFNEEGMKANLLVTLLLSLEHNSFYINDLPNDYMDILLIKLINSFSNKENVLHFVNSFCNGVKEDELFNKHPIEILRDKFSMNDKNIKECKKKMLTKYY